MSLTVQIEKRLGDFRLAVDVESERGTLGLLGASGSGKSLTLKCIAGIERPDRGRIVLDGETLFDSDRGIDLPPQRRRVGYLFQNYALFPTMSVEQNILCGLRWQRDRGERQRALGEMLRLLRLEHVARSRPDRISGGEAQRTALARMLVNRPRLLLLDEPFAALDSHLKGRLQLELKQLLARVGRDAVLVTHSRDEAFHLSDAIGVMEGGRLVVCKPTRALFADPGSVSTARLTGCKNIAPARPAGENRVEVPAWGLTLAAAAPVRAHLTAVGVRAHAFRAGPGPGAFPVVWTGEMEEPFQWTVTFRCPGQAPDCPDLWRRLPKEGPVPPRPGSLWVDPEDVLLLYE